MSRFVMSSAEVSRLFSPVRARVNDVTCARPGSTPTSRPWRSGSGFFVAARNVEVVELIAALRWLNDDGSA